MRVRFSSLEEEKHGKPCSSLFFLCVKVRGGGSGHHDIAIGKSEGICFCLIILNMDMLTSQTLYQVSVWEIFARNRGDGGDGNRGTCPNVSLTYSHYLIHPFLMALILCYSMSSYYLLTFCHENVLFCVKFPTDEASVIFQALVMKKVVTQLALSYFTDRLPAVVIHSFNLWSSQLWIGYGRSYSVTTTRNH